MPSKEKIKKAINNSESAYEQCWTYLTQIKERKFNSEDRDCLLEFQPILANALNKLSKLYREIHQEKNKLIQRKTRLSEAWFTSRMKKLSDYQEQINSAISVGKSLGDAYAWFFYQKDRKYIRQHLQHEEIFHFPPGLGAIGEIEFIKNFKTHGSFFILYHGTTSFLRLGDISLIDLETLNVVAIGELKSSSPDTNTNTNTNTKTIDINLILSSPFPDLVNKKIFKDTPIEAKPYSNRFSPQMNHRLQRQLKAISDSFPSLKEKPSWKKNYKSSYAFDSLTQALQTARKSRVSFTRASKGHLLFSYSPLGKNLYSRITAKNAKKHIDAGMEKIADHAKTMFTTREDNHLIINTIHYSRNGRPTYRPGMTHIFWWPIPLPLLKKIMLAETYIYSIYNPSFLHQKLEDAGFKIKSGEDKIYFAEKIEDELRVEFHGLPSYYAYIQEYMFTEEDIIKIAEKLYTDLIKNHDGSEYGKVEIDIRQQI